MKRKAATVTRGERRRTEAARRAHEDQIRNITQRQNALLSSAQTEHFERGRRQGEAEGVARGKAEVDTARTQAIAAGVARGRADERQAVLDHAGRLYKERKDNDAAAVREVHRLLTEAAK